MVSTTNLLRGAIFLRAVFSSTAENSFPALKPSSVQAMQEVLARDLKEVPPLKKGPPQGPRVEYYSGWEQKQVNLIIDLQQSKDRLLKDPGTLKKMLNTLIVEAKNDTLHSADGFELQVELDPLIEYVCKKLDITDPQVITDFKEMMGAELQNDTNIYAAKYLPKTIKALSEKLIATLEKK